MTSSSEPSTNPTAAAFSRLRARLLWLLESTLAAGFCALTLDVLWGVFSRYALSEQSRWTEELALYLLVWISLLGASVTYAEGGHLGVDYLVSKLDESARQLSRISAELMVTAFAAFVLAYGGFQLVYETLKTGQVSPSLGVRMGYVYLAVPLSGAFFLLFSVERLIAQVSEVAWNRKS